MKRIVAPTFLALTALASTALAQSATEQQPRTGQPGQPSQQSQPGQQGQAGNLDKHIAACLVLGNLEEIAVAEFAKEKCQNEQCKQFAQMMIEQHQQAISKIEQAAPQVAAMDLQLRNANQAAGQQGQSQASQQGGAGGLEPPLMLARQIKEQSLALTKQALSEKQGAEFDKAYIHQQVLAHLMMLAALKGSEPFASQQLQPVLQEGTQMTQEHLAHAEDLLKQLKDSQQGSPRQARAPQQQ